MLKIDRLGWAAGLAFKSYGVSVGVRADSDETLALAVGRLPANWRPANSDVVGRLYSIVGGGAGGRRGVRRFSLLFADHTRLARTLDAAEVFEKFESDLRLHVAERASRRVFVHAGVVGWRGRAILIPGRSFSGKTTLVAELVRAGATYYSDEFAVIDGRGRVHPFPKPLSVREPGRERQTDYPAEHFGGVGGSRPLPIGLVAVSRFEPGARWRPRRLSPGQGMLALLEHAVAARREPARAMSALREVVLGAPVLRGARGEAPAAARAMLESLAERAEGAGQAERD